MSDLPSPLTPPDCDLRGFEWMPLWGHRMFSSSWYRVARKDGRGGIASLKLWWTAILQHPAGSLPNDEEELCMLADFGEDMRAWRKHRGVAMHGFILCSDNRWYHPMVSEQAVKAYECRLKAQTTRQQDADRLRKWRASNGSHPPEKPNGKDPPETPDETRFKPRFETPDETQRETRSETAVKPVVKLARDRQDSTQETRPVQEKASEDKDLASVSPVWARVADACETPPEGTYGAEPTPNATQIAVKNIVGKVGRKLESSGSVPQGKRPQLTVVEQQRAVLYGEVIDPDGPRRGPVDPQRTVEQQLAAIGHPRTLEHAS